MNRLFTNSLVAIAMLAPVGMSIPKAEATSTAATVSRAGVLRQGQNQFFEIEVGREPLQRVRVKCVTFHTLDGVDIFVGDQQVQPDVHFGFEEFILTFAEDVPSGETIRIVIKNSRVRGAVNAGFAIPYRVFGTYASLNNSEIPLGTAIIRVPDRDLLTR